MFDNPCKCAFVFFRPSYTQKRQHMSYSSSHTEQLDLHQNFQSTKPSPFYLIKWRGVRDLNPRGPMDHRLSRPAPYQARRTPHKLPSSPRNLKKVSVPETKFLLDRTKSYCKIMGRLSSSVGCCPYAAEVAGSNPVRPTTF